MVRGSAGNLAGTRQLSAEAAETLRRIISEAKLAGMTQEQFVTLCRSHFEQMEGE